MTIKRVGINKDTSALPLHDQINHLGGGFNPQGSWATSGEWNRDNLSSSGYPNTSVAHGKTFSINFQMLGNAYYSGNYVLSWSGNGQITFSVGTWNVVDPGTATVISNGNYSGTDVRMIVSFTGAQPGLGSVQVVTLRTDLLATNNYLSNLLLCRVADEADYLAGKVFRRAYKQSIIDFNPLYIRFMGNCAPFAGGRLSRFENRKTALEGANLGGSTYLTSPPYGVTSGVNQYTLAAATGMPVAMTHGEIVQCIIGSAAVRGQTCPAAGISLANPGVVSVGTITAGSGYVNGTYTGVPMTGGSGSGMVCTITVSSNGVVSVQITTPGSGNVTGDITITPNTGDTLSAAAADIGGSGSGFTFKLTGYQFLTGDTIVLTPYPSMTELVFKPCTITTIDANRFSLGVNTTGYTPNGTGSFTQYITLDVGGRGAYPVIDGAGGATPITSFHFNGDLAASQKKSLTFDKNLVCSTLVTGAWTTDVGTDFGTSVGSPLEIMTKLIVELNQETNKGPIGMWINLPMRGLLSMDPDYSAGSNLAVGMVDVCLNGANGFPGLKSLSNYPRLFIESCNETWNFAGGFPANYFSRRSFLRWGGATANPHSFHVLRSTVMAEDIKAAFPTETASGQIQFVMAGQGTIGVTAGNTVRIYGDANFDSEFNPGGALASFTPDDPMDHHTHFSWAHYIDGTPGAAGTTLRANYAAQWAAAVGQTAKDAVIADFINTVMINVATGSTEESIHKYRDILLPAYSVEMANKLPLAKKTIAYEGDWDLSITNETTQVNDFKLAVKDSQAWSDAYLTLIRAFENYDNAEGPAVFVQIQGNSAWGHNLDKITGTTYQDINGNIGIEFSGFDLAWFDIGTYNSSAITQIISPIEIVNLHTNIRRVSRMEGY